MPFVATLLMGIAGQAAWKLVNHIYERFTARGTAPAATPADAPAAAGSFQRSLADATSARAAFTPVATSAAAPTKPVAGLGPTPAMAFAGLPALSAPSAPPAMRLAIDSYRLVAHLQAP